MQAAGLIDPIRAAACDQLLRPLCSFWFCGFSGLSMSMCYHGIVFFVFAVFLIFLPQCTLCALLTAHCSGENNLRDKLWALYQRAIKFATQEGTEAGARAHMRELMSRRAMELPSPSDLEQEKEDDKKDDKNEQAE